jgi:hypothetical protein
MLAHREGMRYSTFGMVHCTTPDVSLAFYCAVLCASVTMCASIRIARQVVIIRMVFTYSASTMQ